MMITTSQGDRLWRLDDNSLELQPEEVLVFSCVRNESLRLPYFLDYYRNLGVTRFIFVDNGSTDGTRSFLVLQHDVHVFYTPNSYSRSDLGVQWLHTLLKRFGCHHWVLVVDADELLIYPNSESLKLPEFVRRLEAQGYDALLTFLLDMYARGPIREAHYSQGASFVERCPYFDSDSYSYEIYGERTRVPAIGGVRHRLFWKPNQRRSEPPYLPKIPLVKWTEGLKYQVSTHRIKNVHLASSTGALLHFKLFSDFVERAKIESQRGEHWQGAQQYLTYARGLADDVDLDPMYEGSVRFQSSKQLVEMGLMFE